MGKRAKGRAELRLRLVKRTLVDRGQGLVKEGKEGK
jgi:hypothetical protein